MSHSVIATREGTLFRLETQDRCLKNESWGFAGLGASLLLMLLIHCGGVKSQAARVFFMGGCALSAAVFGLGKRSAEKRHDLQFTLKEETQHFYDLKDVYRQLEARMVEKQAQMALNGGYGQAVQQMPDWFTEECEKINQVFKNLNLQAMVVNVEHLPYGVRYFVDRYSPALKYDKLVEAIASKTFCKELYFVLKNGQICRPDMEGGNLFIDMVEPEFIVKSAKPTGQNTEGLRPTSRTLETQAAPVQEHNGYAAEQSPVAVATAPTNGSQLSVLLGNSRQDGRPRYWIPSQQSNGFFVALGGSGSGKTETLKVMATEIRRYEIPLTICDFHGDILVDGYKTITLSPTPQTPYGINPLELDSKDPNDGGVRSQINIVLEMLDTGIQGGIGHRQRKVIKTALEKAYDAAGINDRNPATYSKPAPTFSNVLDILESDLQNEEFPSFERNTTISVIAVIDAIFSHPVFNKTQQISSEVLASGWYRIKMANLEEPIKYVASETILRKMSRYLRSLGHIPVQPQSDRERYRWFFMVDEAKILSNGGKNKNASTAPLNKAATEDRKFGMGLIFASQVLDHFSTEMLAQMGTRLVLKPLDAEQAVQNCRSIGVSADDLLHLEGKGDGYLKLSDGGAAVRIGVTPSFKRPGYVPPVETPDEFDDWDKRAETSLHIPDVDAALEDMEAIEEEGTATAAPRRGSFEHIISSMSGLVTHLNNWIELRGSMPTDAEMKAQVEALLGLDGEEISEGYLNAIKKQLRRS